MKSPFPGMDPYLERHWRDVQHSLCTYASDGLQPQVLPDLRARIDERLVLDGSPPGSETAMEGFVKIIDLSNRDSLVTVIEFLTMPTKTRGSGLERFINNQRQLLSQGVNLVEVDLLRQGGWVVSAPQEAFPREVREAPYRIVIRRATHRQEAEYFCGKIDEPLPSIRVPLRSTDPDAILDLQALIDKAYVHGAYDVDTDYRVPPVPPLSPELESVADRILRDAGKRK